MKKLFSIFWIATQISCALFPFVPVHASSFSDTLSRAQRLVSANHSIAFTTAGGVNANTDTITLTFGNGFTVSTILFSDVSLTHGAVTGLETTETIAASAAAGVWGAAITGQILTLTPPTDTGAGEISAGDIIRINIGTNAGGTNQITNPPTTGDALVTVGGVIGDPGVAHINIVASDGVSVTATVQGTTQQSQGPTSNNPVVTSFTTQAVTQTSVHLIVTTDVTTTITSEYGLTTSYGQTGPTGTTSATSHDLLLTGLSPNTTYHARVRVAGSGGMTISNDLSFVTDPIPVVAPSAPVISSLTIVPHERYAVVSWVTDVPTQGQLSYSSPTNPLTIIQDVAGWQTTHTITVSGLAPSTYYTVAVSSTAESGLSSYASGDFTTLPDTTAPSNPSGFHATQNATTIHLSWTNPTDPDFDHVVIVYNKNGYPTNPTDGSILYSGEKDSTTMTDPGDVAVLYFSAFAFDTVGNRSSGAITSISPTREEKKTNTQTASTTKEEVDEKKTNTGNTTGTEQIIELHTSSTTPLPTPQSTSTVEFVTTTLPSLPAPTSTPIGQRGDLGIQVVDATSRIILERINGVVPVFISQSVRLLVTIPSGMTPQSAVIRVDGQSYLLTMSPSGETLEATVTLGKTANTRVICSASVETQEGPTYTGSATLFTRALGVVETNTLVGTGTAISGAKITVYSANEPRPWNATTHGQRNPIVTGDDGIYKFVVPNGTYRVVVERDGYKPYDQRLMIVDHLLGTRIALSKTAKTFFEAVAPNSAIAEKLGEAIDLIQSPKNQMIAEQVVAPTLATIVIANAATAVNAFNLFNYLRFLLTQPLLLFKRRKREQWGVVYNSLTKLPIDLAVVRLIDHKTSRVLQTKITDAKGRYIFQLQPGMYRLEIVKNGFVYPSGILAKESMDVDYVDLYHGEPIAVTQATAITPNIPVDPVEKMETPRQIVWKSRFRAVQHGAAVFGVVAAGVGFIVSPSWFMGGFFVLQSATYAIFRRLAIPAKPSKWGYVKDTAKQAIDHAVVRVFDKKFNKLLETQVTDTQGKYGFIVGKSVYYVLAEKPGYKPFKSNDIDTTKGTGHDVLGEHIVLEKG